MSDGMVFVLGAGFTRAFVPDAPLLIGDYGIPDLRKRWESFPHATAILDDALAEYGDGRVDLERLMTRLSGMPYDATDARHEFALLETALRKSLVRQLKDAKAVEVDWKMLSRFAHFVLQKEASIVTFNYDDVLDEALWKASETLKQRKQPASIHSTLTKSDWHPDGGYGFYCRHSSVCVADRPGYMDPIRTLVLKLHGSINWRSRLGEGTTRGPAGILHYEDWYDESGRFPQPADRIEAHLEPDPFIVPPVLVKAELAVHPVLSVVWKLAQERLLAAKTVVFIGYSLPATDLASRTLFRETLRKHAGRVVQIVDFARTDNDNDKKRVKNAYQSLIPDLVDINFDFSGAKAWIEHQPECESTV